MSLLVEVIQPEGKNMRFMVVAVLVLVAVCAAQAQEQVQVMLTPGSRWEVKKFVPEAGERATCGDYFSRSGSELRVIAKIRRDFDYLFSYPVSSYTIVIDEKSKNPKVGYLMPDKGQVRITWQPDGKYVVGVPDSQIVIYLSRSEFDKAAQCLLAPAK